MKLAILIKSVYGNTLYYPMNDAAKSLAGIAGKKTFSVSDLQAAYTQLGFEIEYLSADSFVTPAVLDDYVALAS